MDLVAALFDAGGLTSQATQVEEAGTTYFTTPDNANRLNAGGVEQESSLNANAMRGNPPHSEILVNATTAMANDHTFKILDALATAFNNAYPDAHGIAHPKLWRIGLQVALFDSVD